MTAAADRFLLLEKVESVGIVGEKGVWYDALVQCAFRHGRTLARRLQYSWWIVGVLKTNCWILSTGFVYEKLATLLISVLDMIAQIYQHTVVALPRNVVVH